MHLRLLVNWELCSPCRQQNESGHKISSSTAYASSLKWRCTFPSSQGTVQINPQLVPHSTPTPRPGSETPKALGKHSVSQPGAQRCYLSAATLSEPPSRRPDLLLSHHQTKSLSPNTPPSARYHVSWVCLQNTELLQQGLPRALRALITTKTQRSRSSPASACGGSRGTGALRGRWGLGALRSPPAARVGPGSSLPALPNAWLGRFRKRNNKNPKRTSLMALRGAVRAGARASRSRGEQPPPVTGPQRLLAAGPGRAKAEQVGGGCAAFPSALAPG